MEIVLKALLYLHIITGFASLVIFWIPIFTRKGGINHRRLGKIYVQLMWIVVATAAILSVKNLIIGNTIMGAFLGFISLITASPIWYGVAILKHKQGLSDAYRRNHLLFHLAIVITAFALIAYGIYLRGEGAAVLLFIFGGLGLTDLPKVIRNLKSPPQKAEWLKEHLIGMCSSGIAAYTAFLVFGANQFLHSYLPGYWAIIPWIAPGVIGTFGIRYGVNHYRKKRMIA